MIGKATKPLRRLVGVVLTGPQAAAFTPAIALGAFWLGGEEALILAALAVPLVYLACVPGTPGPHDDDAPRDAVTGLPMRDDLIAHMDTLFAASSGRQQRTACFVLEIANLDAIGRQMGSAAVIAVQRTVADRLVATLRNTDMVACLSGARFGILPMSVRRIDLEAAIQLGDRLLRTAQDQVMTESGAAIANCVLGFCLTGRAPEQTGPGLLSAAEDALEDARTAGPGTIRAYSDNTIQRKTQRALDTEEAVRALDQGQIRAWFQPQISTNTGHVSGFEALARWHHPERGVLTPDHFLPVLQAAGAMEHLGQAMLDQALAALVQWQEAGHHVPTIAVNFSEAELRNPTLADKLSWELDRYGVDPCRMSIEILESVVSAAPEDVVSRNIAKLAELGCMIDLDDFGTGNASIAAIRRFSVNRIKIDRSFVSRLDRDPDQQRMISAILTMAEQLQIDTLAEGVETVGEHAILAQLGCGHVQGFGLSRPMPFDQTIPWMETHLAKLARTPQIGRKTG